jgi:hypothetical protein
MRGFPAIYAFLLINFAACFLLSFFTLWYYAFVPAALLGFFLRSRWINLVYFGISGAIGAVLPIFLSDVGTRFGNAGVLGAIIGLPGGATGPFAITCLIAFLLSGSAAVLTSSIRDIA